MVYSCGTACSWSLNMSNEGRPPKETTVPPAPDLRLDSWKEIAPYLKRSPRTVRRWEREEGLPVRRHLHRKKETVYAFPDEIDAWLKSRRRAESAGHSAGPRTSGLSPALAEISKQESPSGQPIMIAVLPLRNLSGDPDQERFADGLTEELISEVGHCCPKRLRVVAVTSVIQYKQSPKSIEQIGRELGVDYLLEGGIRRYGRRVRMTARLIAARDQAHIWADSYEIQLPSIFSLQQAMARQVADSLAAELHTTPRERRRAITPSVAAHTEYIEGMSHFLPTEGDIKKSLEHLYLALEHDPKFARSYADIALAYFRRLFWDYPPIVTMRRIKELASTALKLDSTLPRAHTMLAAFHLFGAWDWPRAEATSRRAIQLNPSDALARYIRAAYHLVVKEVEEAIEQLAQAHQFDPRCAEVDVWIAIFAYYSRRYDLAVERCQEVLQLDPSLAITHRLFGLCYAQTGDYGLALSHCEKAKELDNVALSTATVATAVASSIYASAGERDSAERLLQQLVAAKEKQYMRYVFLATASVGLGNHQQTLEWLEKAYEQRDPLLVFLAADPRFHPLSGLPRFRQLLRRIGLPS